MGLEGHYKRLLSQVTKTSLYFSGRGSCPPPERLDYGFIHGQQFWEGEHVSFSCKPGYRLSGSSERKCLKNGAWTGHQPKCHRGNAK